MDLPGWGVSLYQDVFGLFPVACETVRTREAREARERENARGVGKACKSVYSQSLITCTEQSLSIRFSLFTFHFFFAPLRLCVRYLDYCVRRSKAEIQPRTGGGREHGIHGDNLLR